MNLFRQPLRGLLVIAALLVARPASANPDVFDKTIRSTCWVVVIKDNSPEFMQGTGWLVGKNQVITNFHVVGEAKHVFVVFPTFRDDQLVVESAAYQGKGIKGEVVKVDNKRDLALIQIGQTPAGAKTLPLASAEPAAGQTIYSIGNSSMAGKHVTDGTLWKFRQGTISKVGFRTFFQDNTRVKVEARILVSDCGMKGGDSGGPVVNDKGQLVGVASSFDRVTSHGMTIHVEEVKRFLGKDELPTTGPISPLVGPWTMKFNVKGQDLYAGLIFHDNGAVSFETPDKILPGKYSLEKNRLVLQVPALAINDDVTVTFDGHEAFQFTSQNIEFAFQRR